MKMSMHTEIKGSQPDIGSGLGKFNPGLGNGMKMPIGLKTPIKLRPASGVAQGKAMPIKIRRDSQSKF